MNTDFHIVHGWDNPHPNDMSRMKDLLAHLAILRVGVALQPLASPWAMGRELWLWNLTGHPWVIPILVPQKANLILELVWYVAMGMEDEIPEEIQARYPNCGHVSDLRSLVVRIQVWFGHGLRRVHLEDF